MTTEKVKQLPLPEGAVIEVKNHAGAWVRSEQLPSEGRYRVKVTKQPPRKK